MVIVYKLAPITYWLGRLLVKIAFIGLPNIIAGKSIVKELIQQEANADNMAAEIKRILTDQDYRDEMCSQLAAVKKTLGAGGGSTNMALLVAEMLSQSP
jgi:lipid-A-disaccharide synthase